MPVIALRDSGEGDPDIIPDDVRLLPPDPFSAGDAAAHPCDLRIAMVRPAAGGCEQGISATAESHTGCLAVAPAGHLRCPEMVLHILMSSGLSSVKARSGFAVADARQRRKNYRKVKLTAVNPGEGATVSVPPLPSGPLPGEAGPLVCGPDRKPGPVTDDEALGALRRREAVQLASVYAESSPQALADAGLPATLDEALASRLPTALPNWDSKVKPASYRLPERLLALMAARAELECVKVNAWLELLVWDALLQPVRDPAEVAKAYDDMKKRTVVAERVGLHD